MLYEIDEDGLYVVYYVVIGGNVFVMFFFMDILNDIVYCFSIFEKNNINIL